MMWALLVFVGVPLWLCALGIFTVIYRNRALRRRRGDIPDAVWISDVFAWRGSPAAWSEGLLHVLAASVAPAGPEERKRLHRRGVDPVVGTLTLDEGTALRVAVSGDDRAAVLGPFQSMPDRNALGPMT